MNNLTWLYRNGDWLTHSVITDVAIDYTVNNSIEHDGIEEWLLAERNDDSAPKNDVSDNEVDVTTGKRSKTEHNGADSREKLLEDVNALAIDYWSKKRTWGEAGDLKREIIALLDRQEAIVERRMAKQWKEQASELVGHVNELTAERDEWKAKAEGYAEALEKLGCSVLANGTVFELSGNLDTQSRAEIEDADMSDSREKLEADVLKYYTHTTSTLMWPDDANIKTKWVSVSMGTVLEWLDRQEAITKHAHPGLTISEDESLINWHGKNYLLQSRVLNAERERDEFSLKLKHEMELNRDNRNALDLERIADLQQQVDDLRDEWHRVCAERDNLARDLAECERMREGLRARLSEAIGKASQIAALGDL